MENNFDFTHGQVFYDNLVEAEKFASTIPELSGWKARRALEQIVHKSFALHPLLSIPRDFTKKHHTIGELIYLECFEELMNETAPGIFIKWDTTRDLANKATHESSGTKLTQFNDNDAVRLLSLLRDVLEWFYVNVLDNHDEIPDFNRDLLPSKLPEEIVKEEYLTKFQLQEEEHIKQLETLREEMEFERARMLSEFQSKVEEPEPEFLDVGLTEQTGLIWGRVYLNFKYLDTPFYAVKYFQNEGGAKEKLLISKGLYQQSDFYKMFPQKTPGCAVNSVLSGTFDNLNLVLKFDKHRFGTPSLLLQKLIQGVLDKMSQKTRQIDESEQQEKLDSQFEFFGSYYKVNDVGFRNLLTVQRKGQTVGSYDALVIMINPGGSYPLNSDDYQDKVPLDTEKTGLVPCNPDSTQYQICRLMNLRTLNNVAVINLFDICDTDSRNVFERYLSNKSLLEESIFHSDRRNELNGIMAEISETGPVIIAWGMNKSGSSIKKQIYNKVLVPSGRELFGWSKPGKEFHYYHPYPRGEENQWIRNEWPAKIHEQLQILKPV